MSMEIIRAGILTTVQDQGRQGYARHGFEENGACDKLSLWLANLLVGNPDKPRQAAALEFTMKGAQIRFSSREVIALAGADMTALLNERPIPRYCPVVTAPGDILTLGVADSGLRGYLAVHGGIDVPLVMSSCSTSLKCGIGGYYGRALQHGDVLRSGASLREIRLLAARLAGREERWHRAALEMQKKRMTRCGANPSGVEILRMVAGPQEEAFTPTGMNAFATGRYCLTVESDRMACRLDGPVIETRCGSDIISDGIVEGSVQVASDGRPIVMMADHQTTGGYAKIGTVISADIPRLAQLRPGDSVMFRFVTLKEAVAAARELAGELELLKRELKGL